MSIKNLIVDAHEQTDCSNTNFLYSAEKYLKAAEEEVSLVLAPRTVSVAVDS